MKKFRIPFEKLQSGEVVIEANSLKEAIERVNTGDMPEGCPDFENSYLCEVNEDLIEEDPEYYGEIKGDN